MSARRSAGRPGSTGRADATAHNAGNTHNGWFSVGNISFTAIVM